MDNITELPPATVGRLSAMSDTERDRLLSDFKTEINRSGFCDWLSYAFMLELGVK